METSTTTDIAAVSKMLRERVENMQGMDFVRALIEGDLPESPLIEALGVRTASAAPGEASLETTPQPQQFNIIGSGHGGFLSTLLDTALGLAVQTMTEPGVVWPTTDLHVRFRRPMTADSGRVVATGRVEHLGHSTATAAGEVRDGEGRVLATATASFFALRRQA
jgi:uncharacterized protein (TIGR00369 family)